MRYLVQATLKPNRKRTLLDAINDGSIGFGSVAYGEYERNMREARLLADGRVKWVEVCYCATPLEEEIPFWEEYFELNKITNAHNPEKCRDISGEEGWACTSCDCTEKLEAHLESQGTQFLTALEQNAD